MAILWSDLFRRVLHLRCPVCGRGKVFHGWLRGPQYCSECGYIFRRREGGYFLVSMGINYFATVFATTAAWFLLELVFKVRSLNTILFLTVAVAAFFSVWFFRYSRMLWMAVDLIIDPPVREDFMPRP